MAGSGGSDSDAKLSVALLSSALKKYPKSTAFAVSWDYTVAMGTDSFEMFYDRKRSQLNFKENWRRKPSHIKRFSKVTEAMIHAAARKGDSYANINS